MDDFLACLEDWEGFLIVYLLLLGFRSGFRSFLVHSDCLHGRISGVLNEDSQLNFLILIVKLVYCEGPLRLNRQTDLKLLCSMCKPPRLSLISLSIFPGPGTPSKTARVTDHVRQVEAHLLLKFPDFPWASGRENIGAATREKRGLFCVVLSKKSGISRTKGTQRRW